ncbi:MAG: cyclase family protein [Anaerolineales bacterium]
MALYDISLTLSEKLPTWPGDPPLKLKKVSSISEGESFNVTHISSSLHIGTHVDAPYHILESGQTVDQLPLDLLVGPAWVFPVRGDRTITSQDLRDAGITQDHKRVLLQTFNSKLWNANQGTFQDDFLALASDAAEYLVTCGVEVVGVDYLSVAPFPDQVTTHHILLEAGVLIIEGLNLAGIEPGSYQLLCLPLKVAGADGAPARVLLQA